MGREDVNIKVSANVAEAIQLWKAMEAGPEGMAKALDAMGQKGAKSAKGIGDEILGFVGKWASVGVAVSAVTSEINRQYEALKRLREEKNAATNTVDEVWNRFQVQAGLPNGPRADQVRNQLLSIIATRKAGPVQGLQAAEQLGSAGASVQDILGGGLDEFLQLITASNAAGQDVNVPQLAQAMVKFLAANGKQPNREGMRGTSLAIQQLFGGTNLQLSNLARFAPEAGKIASFSHLAPEDQLAVYSQFLGTMDESTAAVAFRGGVSRLATAGAVPERVSALKSLGLKPGDVDFQGEDFFTVLDRLRKGFGGVKPEQANIAAQRIFGDESLGFYSVMLQPGAVEEAKKRGVMARDATGAAERLSLAESSRGAAARQAETLAAATQYDKEALDPAVIRKRLQALTNLYIRSEQSRASVMGDFDDPFGPDVLYSSDPNDIASRAAGRLSGALNLRHNIIAQQAGKKYLSPADEQAFILQQIRGTQPIRIVGPDGLDVPSEPAANELGR